MDELLKRIDQFVIEKSLSLDVLEVVRKIQKEHSDSINTIKDLEDSIKIKDENFKVISLKNESLTIEVNQLKGIVSDFKLREKDFIESEHKTALKDKEVESANRVVNEVKDVVALVFKNASVKRTVFGIEACPTPQGGYASTVNTSKTEEITHD